MVNKINKKASMTMEAALLIAIVTAGLLAMRFYLKGAIQGNWRTNIDSFSEEQFRPQKDWFGKNDPNYSHISGVPVGQAHDPNNASEPHTWQEQEVTAIRIINPTFKVQDIKVENGKEKYGTRFASNFDSQVRVHSSKDTQILQIPAQDGQEGWGTYKGDPPPEDDE